MDIKRGILTLLMCCFASVLWAQEEAVPVTVAQIHEQSRELLEARVQLRGEVTKVLRSYPQFRWVCEVTKLDRRCVK